MLGGQDGKFKNKGNAFFGNTCVSAIVLVTEEDGETLDSRHGGGSNLLWDFFPNEFFPFRPDTRD